MLKPAVWKHISFQTLPENTLLRTAPSLQSAPVGPITHNYYQHMRVTSARLWFPFFSNSSLMDNGAHGFLISAKGWRRIVNGKLGKNSSSIPANNQTLLLVYADILAGSRPYSRPRVPIPRRILVIFGNCGGLTSGQNAIAG